MIFAVVLVVAGIAVALAHHRARGVGTVLALCGVISLVVMYGQSA